MAKSDEKTVRTVCPRCACHLKAPATKVGRRLPCPKCGHPIKVVATEPTAAPESADDEYALKDMTYAIREPLPEEHSGPVVPVAGVPDKLSAGALSEDEAPSEDEEEVELPSERPKPPPYPMINGVLDFFVQPTAVICWASFSLTVVIASSAAAFGASAAGGGRFGAVAAFLMGLLAIAVAALASIAITGYLMAILQDSAAGNKVIINWPDLVFIDWIGGSFYILVSLIIPFGVSCVLAWPAGGIMANGWLVPVTLWLLFPIVLLSTLETQSPLLPFSPVVLQSLWLCGRTWVVFFLETCLMGAGLALLAAGVRYLGLETLGISLLAGAGVAAAMVYFRLLGRLAWVCDDRFRQEPAEDEEDEDDQETPEETETPEIRPTPTGDF